MHFNGLAVEAVSTAYVWYETKEEHFDTYSRTRFSFFKTEHWDLQSPVLLQREGEEFVEDSLGAAWLLSVTQEASEVVVPNWLHHRVDNNKPGVLQHREDGFTWERRAESDYFSVAQI